MNTTQRAYINGFVKRANDYGLTQAQAFELLKQAGRPVPPPQHNNDLGAALSTKAKGPVGPTHSGGIETMPAATRQSLRLPAVPAAPPQHNNDLGRFTRP